MLGLLSTDDLLAEEIELSLQPAVDALEREFDMTVIDAARAVQDAARPRVPRRWPTCWNTKGSTQTQ